MDFSTRGPQPQKHALGITMVIAFHAIVIYALVTGLGKKIVDVIKQPIETKVIEEVKPPPPPPERLLPPPPKLEAPPPPFIPPPEVQIATPPPTMPRKALQTGTGGTVVARATIRGGKVVEVEIRSSNPRGLFDSAVKEAMMQYTCAGDHIADQEFVFKVD